MANKNRPRSAQRADMEIPQGALFVQKGGANSAVEYLTCSGVTGMTDEKGAPTYGYCWDGEKYVVKSRIKPPPTGASFEVATGLNKVKSVMDSLMETDCTANFVIKYSNCGKPFNLCEWDILQVVEFADVNTRNGGDPVAFMEQARIERSFSVSSPDISMFIYRPYPKSYTDSVDPAQTEYGASAVPTNIHVPVGRGSCGGACANYEERCDFAVAGNDSGIGTPGATNESGLLITRDGGATWEFLPGGQDDVAYTHGVLLDDGTLVGVGHLDDGTAVWASSGFVTATTADFGTAAAVATGLTGATVLSVYTDGREVWFTTLNRIYRSVDGGATWDLMHTGAAGDVIRSIHFNGETGFATGEDTGGATLILRSDNGGDSWTDISSQDVGDAVSVYVQTNVVWIGTEDGLYYSTNNGVTWNERILALGGGITDVEFYNDSIGVAVSGTRTYFTAFGGAENTWCALDTSGITGGSIEFCAPDTFWQIGALGALTKYQPKLA